MAISTETLPRSSPDSSQPGGPPERDGSLRFDATVVLAALWFMGGLLVDGWAHYNLDLSTEGFFTPYHALFYSGFAAIAAVILMRTYRNHTARVRWAAAIPGGYEVTLAGLAIFAIGGVLDMLWHLAFGIEQDIAALFSPTHLVLAFGIGAILSGPIRAGISRRPSATFRAQWPTLAALSLFATLVNFFFLWAFGLAAAAASAPHIAYPQLTGDALAAATDDRLARGIEAIVFRSLLMVGTVLWAARRLALPRGGATLLIVVPSTLIGTMLDPSIVWVGPQFLAAVVAGIFADVCLARGLNVSHGSWKTRAFAFGIPFAFWTTYVALAAAAYGGLWWNAHVIAGAPVIGGLVALLFELVAEPRANVVPERP